MQLINITKDQAYQQLISAERQDGQKETTASLWEKGDCIVAFMVATSPNKPGLFSETQCAKVSD